MSADRHDETYAAVKASRSPELSRRYGAHEVGHALVGRALGSIIELVTIVPHGEYAGRCVRRGASSSLNLLNEQEVETSTQVEMPTTADVVALCVNIGAPEVGTPRVDLAEEITRAQVQIVELVAGSICERIMFPNLPVLPAAHDWREAEALASVICAAPAAEFLAYAEAEAEALIRANIDIVEELSTALVQKGTLLGCEVDEIITACVTRRALKAEHERRRRWREIEASAERFKAECRG